MARLNLTAKNSAERQVLKYLDENASETLEQKINARKKTLSGALAYCKEQARKQASGGVACVDDPTVYGWVIHYFEEEGEDPDRTTPPRSDPTPRKKRAAKEAAPEAATFSREPDFEDIDIFGDEEP